MPGRPKHFDENQALEQAMELFWAKGYDCTGISDLEQTLELGRQSIYNTFGDKRALFLKAFRHYSLTQGSHMITLLQEDGTDRERLNRFFTALISAQCSDQRAGCFLSNSLNSSIRHDNEVLAVIDDFLTRLHKAVSDCLKNTLADSKKRNTAAWLLVNTAQGFCVLSKAGQPKETLIDIKKQTLDFLFQTTQLTH